MTRARAQASPLAARLRALGAERGRGARDPHRSRSRRTIPPLAGYDLLCLTSPNAVRRLFEEVRDARALTGPRIAAIGPGTAQALREHGIEPDIVPGALRRRVAASRRCATCRCAAC